MVIKHILPQPVASLPEYVKQWTTCTWFDTTTTCPQQVSALCIPTFLVPLGDWEYFAGVSYILLTYG
jgi:hypothetical protein